MESGGAKRSSYNTHNHISGTQSLNTAGTKCGEPLRMRSHLVPGHYFPGIVQNGALSKLWVPKLSFVHFGPSPDAIFEK